MKLSVIIPFYIELNLINRCINSALINSTFFSEFEFIIINDGLFKENEIRDCLDNNLKCPEYYCHSMNPVGKENILNLLNSFNKYDK